MALTVHRYKGTDQFDEEIILVIPEITATPGTLYTNTLDKILEDMPNVISSECTIITSRENVDAKIQEYFTNVIQSYFYNYSSPYTITFNPERRIQIYYDGYRPTIKFQIFSNGEWINRLTGGGFPNGSCCTIDYMCPAIDERYVYRLTLVNNSGNSFTLATGSTVGSTVYADAVTFWNGVEEYVPPGPGPEPKEDPYDPGGESGEEGGEGDFDNTSDEIEIPDLPTASTVINTGFITLYDANIYDLNDLASYLWSANGLDLETFKKIFADPISAILGLSIFPCSPEITTQDVNVILGNIDTGVGMRKVTNQYRRYDMGTLNLNEYWGGYLDYSPYTSVEIYLPYIGTRTLNADDVMGKALHLVYNIDFLSGSCCAILEVGGTVLYQFMGQCSCPVPVTGRDMTNLVNGVMSVVGAGVGTLVATGGNAALAGASAIGSLASHVTSSKPKIEKSGAMGGMGGMLGVRKPYLVVTRPRQALPASQNTYTGYPSYMTCMLGDLIGFTVMETVHLQDMSATDEEKAEIDRLLKTGVVL